MAGRVSIPVLLVLCWACMASVSADLDKLSTANSDFAFDLYKKLASEAKGDNLFFSPVSVSTAMAMLHAGAKGKTREEMAEVLRFGSLGDDGAVNDAFQALLEDLNSPASAYNLSVANRLFGRKGYKFRQEFIKLTDEKFSASLEELDFENNPKESTDYINDWVEQQTEDKIKDLIPDGAINAMTALVLVNAIYFSGNWQFQFKEEDTQPRDFYLNKNEQVEMETMYIEKYFKMAEISEWKCRMLELPYKENGEVSLFIILPDEVDGLSDLEEKVNVEGIEKVIDSDDSMSSSKIKVYLPKFKISTEVNMKKIFKDLGISEVFKPNVADLSAINGRDDLYLTEVIHKAYVDVNEKGTEAAAATGLVVGITSITPEIKFEVNRPSLFFIRDKSSKSILFMGRLVKPPGDGATIGTFGQADEDTNSGSNLLTSILFSIACFLLASINTM